MFRSNQVAGPKRWREVQIDTRRILVVDDEASIREVVAVCLKRLGGWDVITAGSGQEALDQAKTQPLDAIVLDGMMPEMDGLVFLHHLRTDPMTQQIPVVLLTTNSELHNPQVFLQLGVVLTISKPFQSVDLVQQIARVMGW